MEDLTPGNVGAWLVAQGLLAPGAAVDAYELGGGVSNVVLAVTADGLDAVVKQALPRLRVEDEWLAKRERILTEAAALKLAGRITESVVPAVLAVDAERCAIAIERAPETWTPWKDALLRGEVDAGLAARLGAVLAAWHRETVRDAAVAERFGDHEAFDQLRVDPYHRTVMRRWPRLARAVGVYVDQMVATRVCLVHGDYSPKNVLVGAEGLMVLDFEVAHVGDPVFDLAFMLNHLLLKTIRRPESAASYRAAGVAFLDVYRDEAGPALDFDPAFLCGQIGCLMVARVDGKSPVEYLSEAERMAARAAGARLLLDPPDRIEEAWSTVTLR
jgi:aminoglycoside phosphotransferase (APT) family kinase protein